MFIIDYNNPTQSISIIANKTKGIVNGLMKDILRTIPLPGILNLMARPLVSRYSEEIQIWEQYSPYISLGNISYELDGLIGFNSLNFCSSMCSGPDHYRTLDWPLEGLKKWYVVKCINAPAGEFKMVGVPGMVGCLTGVAKGRFSISVNADATQCDIRLTGTPIAILVRMALEKCETMNSAIQFLKNKKVMRSSFVHIVSPSGNSKVIRMGSNEIINTKAITNHDPRYVFSGDMYRDSIERLKAINGCELNMYNEPVYNEQTMQFVIMNSKTGEIEKGD